MNWWVTCMQKYADFNGRARRTEYWMFSLLSFIFAIFAVILDNFFGTAFEETGYGLIYIVFVLGITIPSWAVLVRRLHDIGKSGWWVFISVIPIIGAIWLFILTVTDSEPGSNEYGENPKLLSA